MIIVSAEYRSLRVFREVFKPVEEMRYILSKGEQLHLVRLDGQQGEAYLSDGLSHAHFFDKLGYHPTNFTTGGSHSFGGTYLELVPGKRVSYTAAFDDANLPGQMKTSVDLTPVSCGVEIRITQEGIPSVIPTEACYLGWQESLEFLAKLVEPNFPE